MPAAAAAAASTTDLSPAVRAVCERQDAAVDIVMATINSFVDVSPRWNLNLAALCGHLRLVQRLSARQPQLFDQCCTEAIDSAAEFGHMDIVQWLHHNRREGCTKDAMNMAAANGHLAIVQWLHTHRKEGCSRTAMDFAAQHGHLHVVQWLHAHRKEGCSRAAMDNAAKEGRLHVVQWLHLNRREGCSRSAFENACAEGHRELAQWLLTHRRRNCHISRGLDKAIAYSKPAVVDWLHALAYWDSDYEGATDEEDDNAQLDDDNDEFEYELRQWLQEAECGHRQALQYR